MTSKRRHPQSHAHNIINGILNRHQALPPDHPRHRITLPRCRFLEWPDPDDAMRVMTLRELMEKLRKNQSS